MISLKGYAFASIGLLVSLALLGTSAATPIDQTIYVANVLKEETEGLLEGSSTEAGPVIEAGSDIFIHLQYARYRSQDRLAEYQDDVMGVLTLYVEAMTAPVPKDCDIVALGTGDELYAVWLETCGGVHPSA